MSKLNKYEHNGLIYLSIIFLLTIMAGLKEPEIFGFRICGWSWVISLFIAFIYFIIIRGGRITFPFIWWAPFFIYLFIVSDFTQEDDVYRFLIFLCPILVGLSASRFYLYNYNKLRIYNIIALGGLLFVYIISVLISGNRLPTDIYAIAGPPMTAVLLTIIALEDASMKRVVLYIFVFICFVFCLLIEARMSILAIGIIFVLRFRKFSLATQISIFVIMLIAAILLFQTDTVQSNLFRRGYGSVADLFTFDPSILKTGGRLYAWPIYWEEIMNKPWFGHGSTFSVDFGAYAFGGWAHPHNEYIRMLFDYGFVGAVLFIIPIFYLAYQCFKGARHALTEETKWLCSIGFWGITVMFLLAITGNVLMYAAWYGNLLFALIGFGLSLLNFEQSTYMTKNNV